MSHPTLFMLVFLLMVASFAFPPSQQYYTLNNVFLSAWQFKPYNAVNISVFIPPTHFERLWSSGDMYYAPNPDKPELQFNTDLDNWVAFVWHFRLNESEWKSIPYDHKANTFTIQFHGMVSLSVKSGGCKYWSIVSISVALRVVSAQTKIFISQAKRSLRATSVWPSIA
ncbi:hypothetical protein FOZ62_005717 [Perkinsus olseni]|uniref:Uncharacterized protein n=1 Tax=Perkinsus olseni TaxID=32597 RepID=A0A7J6RVL8_PEROL|nr:hypothetical protein FOZ62_005717 [Perkinsus olseni]